jgi:hypothetical protein
VPAILGRIFYSRVSSFGARRTHAHRLVARIGPNVELLSARQKTPLSSAMIARADAIGKIIDRILDFLGLDADALREQLAADTQRGCGVMARRVAGENMAGGVWDEVYRLMASALRFGLFGGQPALGRIAGVSGRFTRSAGSID